MVATFLFVLILSSLAVSRAHAAAAAFAGLRTASGGSVNVHAKSMFRDSDREVIELKGDVQIIYDQQYIGCDQAIIDLKSQTVSVEGNLVINSPQAYVEGDRAILSYVDNTGTIINGFVKSGPVVFEGKVVRKTGPLTYEADEASYTACTTCPAAWSFAGSRIRAEIGSYAYIKQSVIRVADIPVLWLPYLIVPLKSQRQTGLLIPSLDLSGDGGVAPALHFFWAISRSQDALITGKWYEKRGPKMLVNYRYMLSEKSQGELNVGLLTHDSYFAQLPQFTDNPVGSSAQRSFLNYTHRYELPYGFTNQINLNYASDLRYSRDFPEELLGQGDPALENRVSLTHNTETTHASLDMDYYINQLKSRPNDSNRDAVHRWPELRYSLTDRRLTDWTPLSPLLLNFSTDYVNFARDDFAFDDITGTGVTRQVDLARTGTGAGVFNPQTDLIRAGQRLDFQPELAYPFRVGPYLDVLPTLQFRHTQYLFNVNPPPGSDFDASPYRQYLRGRMSFRTRFSRIFGSNEAPENSPDTISPAMHTVESGSKLPETQAGWVDQESGYNAAAAAGSSSATSQNSNLGAQIPVSNNHPPTAPVRPSLYRHEIEPEIALTGVKYLQQNENNPFFGEATQLPTFVDSQPVSDSDFQSTRGLQFDYEDRVINRNTISFLLGNRLVRKNWINGTPNYKQIASFKIGQSYDLDELKRTTGPKFPWSDISALLDVRLEHFETNTVVRYFPYHNKTNTSARAKIMDDHGRFLQLNVAQTFLINQDIGGDVDHAYNERTEDVGLSAGFDSRYLGFAGGIDYNPDSWWPMRFAVKSWSTVINLKPPGDCWGIRLLFRKDIVPATDNSPVRFKLEFDYQFGGAGA